MRTFLRARACATAACLCAAAGPAVQAACAPPQWALAAGAEHSRWQEHAADGRRLVQERGTLATLALQAGLDCAGVQWQAEVGLADGQRGYQGLSSTGQPISSHSGIARQQWQVAAVVPLSPQTTGGQTGWQTGGQTGGQTGWQTGAAIGQTLLQRDIASAGAVLGYPERFSQWQASALLARSQALQPGLVLRAALQLGGGPAGRLHLQLPTADAATLRLGTRRHAQLGLGLHASLPSGLGWQVGLQWQHTRTGAGPAATLWRNGRPVGAAAQPASRLTGLGLQAALHW